MQPLTGFNAAVERSKHLLRLYELLHDTRERAVRGDWSARFLGLMRWPAGERIVRVDGKDRASMLILRQSTGIDREHFNHEYLSELLRSAIVGAVSALDRYLHDVVIHHSWKLLNQAEEDVPVALRTLTLSVITTKNALQHLRKDPKSRPGNIVKRALQEQLHRNFTFQRPDSVLKAGKMLGISDFWGQVAAKMPGSPSKKDVIDELTRIAARRNQIVHEADLILRTKAAPKMRDIEESLARRWVGWIEALVAAIDEVVDAEL